MIFIDLIFEFENEVIVFRWFVLLVVVVVFVVFFVVLFVLFVVVLFCCENVLVI